MSEDHLKTVSDSDLLDRYVHHYSGCGCDSTPYLNLLEKEILSRMGAAHVVRSIPEDAPNDVAIRTELPDGRIVEITPKAPQSVVVGLPDDFMLRALRAGVVTTMQVTKVDTDNGFFLAKDVNTHEELKFPIPEKLTR
jgi:hypothetical protein